MKQFFDNNDLEAEDLGELEIHVCSFHLGGRTQLICNNERIMHDHIVEELFVERPICRIGLNYFSGLIVRLAEQFEP